MSSWECLTWTILFLIGIAWNIFWLIAKRNTAGRNDIPQEIDAIGQQEKLTQNPPYVPSPFEYRDRAYLALSNKGNGNYPNAPKDYDEFYKFLDQEYRQQDNVSRRTMLWIAIGLLSYGRKDVIKFIFEQIVEAQTFSINGTFLPIFFHYIPYPGFLFPDSPGTELECKEWIEQHFDKLEWNEETCQFVLNEPAENGE